MFLASAAEIRETFGFDQMPDIVTREAVMKWE